MEENIKNANSEQQNTGIAENEQTSEIPVEKSPEKKKRKKRRLEDYTVDNDIKFKGPFSYRHFRIFAWICIAIAQVGALLAMTVSIGKVVDPVWTATVEELFYTLRVVFGVIGKMSLPFFLFAAFAIILCAKNGYKKLFISYGSVALLFIAGFFFVYYHYLIGGLGALMQDPAESKQMAKSIIESFSTNGYLSFNIFIDLLLFTAFMYFVNYHPTKYFQGKKIKYFRMLSVLPLIYEITSILLKGFSAAYGFELPIFVYPFLTTKSPMMFVIFVLLAIFIKNRERIFRKRGKTHEDYKEFLKTNANSFQFAIFTSIIIAVVVAIDLATLFIISSVIEHVNDIGKIITVAQWIYSLGIGQAWPMLLTVPFILLFSYTKTHKNPSIDLVIPMGGMGLTVFVYVEGIFLIIRILGATALAA
ncbi:MAG: hypothetical protein SPL13_01160 [Clostridia bacterium]|nr:hypothetical protein [Clostridia bacterium]